MSPTSPLFFLSFPLHSVFKRGKSFTIRLQNSKGFKQTKMDMDERKKKKEEDDDDDDERKSSKRVERERKKT